MGPAWLPEPQRNRPLTAPPDQPEANSSRLSRHLWAGQVGRPQPRPI